MKRVIPILLILFFFCAKDEAPTERPNRFLNSLKHASEISTVERLTQDGRCISPMFAPGDTIIYFRRLLAPDNEAASGKEIEDLIKPFGININTMELLTVSADYEYPPPSYADTSKLPEIGGESVTMGINSPDSGVIAFETDENGPSQKRKIYIYDNDRLSQLTYGDISCYLEKISNSGRYISALLDWNPSWIIIFDLESGENYIIERENELIDYMTSFSSDDRMMVFIRSEGRYIIDGSVFGDIWLFRFKQQ
ncbi:MAG: hypothetical protein JSW64_04515 [Candidatus Zixiibacteriota bacterium]|nr:MAG: hypothetical protein JSW64_04515 [candidate division Zixibacteria bacterium]